MVPAPRDRESEILKDSKRDFSGDRVLYADPDLRKVCQGKIMS